jgi:hypothetical protein
MFNLAGRTLVAIVAFNSPSFRINLNNDFQINKLT